MSNVLFDEDAREAAIRKLWELKLSYETLFESEQKKIKFDRLIKDENYRHAVLSKLTTLDHKELAGKALELVRLGLRGSLYSPIEANASEGIGVGSGARTDASLESKSSMENSVAKEGVDRRWQIVCVMLAAVLVVSLSANLYHFSSTVRWTEVVVNENILEDTTWTSGNTYFLENTIFVDNNAHLYIEAGTTVKGKDGAALIVTRNAQIVAKGSAENPIVFTSANPVGARAPGDWGGVLLLGNAPVNLSGSHVEGVSATEMRGYYGGIDPLSSCGILEYVRIEFAGYEIFQNNELNGLTLGGCGSNTIIRHVQVHKSLDDGIEVFGGTVNLNHIVITGAGDDAFDWDMGWQGNVQFLVVQLHHDRGDNALEGDNHDDDPDAQPRSRPNFYNVTLVGANNNQIAQRAMLLKEGSGANFSNMIVTGFMAESVDFRGEAVERLANDGLLSITDSIFYTNEGGDYFLEETDDDFGFSEYDFITQGRRNNMLGLDPRLPASVYSLVDPVFTPFVNSPALNPGAEIPQGEFWDIGANYLGAVRPGLADTWLSRWTQFPSN